ncbi:MAG: hypothetical protein ACJ8I9_09730 [Chthoniobacterales bacterium]
MNRIEGVATRWFIKPDVVRLLTTYLLVIGSVLPPLIALRTQIRYWVDIPIWDEWDTPGVAILHWTQHKLTWADLIAQHNESRQVVPRLVGILLAASGHWDVRSSMILTFVSYCVASLLAFFFLRRCTRTLNGTLAALVCINLLLFAPSQYENLLSSYIYEFFVPVLCLFGAAAVNLSTRSYITKTIWCALFALIGTYTFAHGMLLWPLLLPLPSRVDWTTRSTKARTLCLLASYGAIATAAVLYYFVGYFHPSVAPEPAKISQAAGVLRFLSIYVGSVLQPIRLKPELVGAFVLYLWVVAVVIGTATLLRRRDRWRCYYLWLLLALFGAGSGLLTAVGRLNIGTDLVFAETFYGFSGVRYNAPAVFVYIALIGIVAGLFASAQAIRGFPAVAKGVTIVTIVVLTVAWFAMRRNEPRRLSQFRENRLRARVATFWAPHLPANPELFAAYPYIQGFGARVEAFKQAGLLGLPDVGPELASAVRNTPVSIDPTGGCLDRAAVVDKTHVRLSGWARDPSDNKPAAFVIVGYERISESFQPFATVLVGKPRPDVVATTSNKGLRQSGFDQTIEASGLPAGHLVFRAWAVDIRHQRVIPLSGSAVIDHNGI